MKSNNTKFFDTVYNLLKTKGAGPEVIDSYTQSEGDWEAINELFVIIATFVEEKVNEQRKSLTKKKKKKKSSANTYSPDRTLGGSTINSSNGF